MNVYESYSKEEIMDFIYNIRHPEAWMIKTRINPENMRIIYVLKWI